MELKNIKNWENYWLKFENGNTPASMEIDDSFLDNFSPNLQVLDIGCGYGRISEQIAKLGCKVTGIDINEKEIQAAKLRCEYLQNTTFQVMSGENIEFNDNEFDIAILMGTIGGVQRDLRRKILNEAYRVLKKEGLIYVGELSLKTGDLEREKIYQRDMKITGEYGSRVVFSKSGEQGEILFVGKHFLPEELKNLLLDIGFHDVFVHEHFINKKGIVDKGVERRKQLSVWGVK